MKKLIETKFGTETGKLDSWVGKGEVLTDGYSAHVVNRGSKVGVDDVPALTGDTNIQSYDEGKSDTTTGVLGNLIWPRLSNILRRPISYAEGTRKAASNIEQFDKKFNKKLSDDIEVRRGVGSVTIATNLLKERNRNNAIGNDLALINQAIQDLKTEQSYAGYKKGKNLLKCDEGWIPNAITSGLGLIGSIGLYISAKNQKLNNPDIYVSNPYEQQALTTLAGLRDNPYNLLRAMQDAEARNRYAINQSGGLTGSLKYLANVSSGIGMQRNYADVLQRAHLLNNQYKAQWANAALLAGAQTALRQQAANQYRDEVYARSHAARQQQMQTAIQNGLGQIQQFYANEFARTQFNKNMNLYLQLVDIERSKIDSILKGLNPKQEVKQDSNWRGGIPLVLTPGILDVIPDAINKPKLFDYKNINWGDDSWSNNIVKKYGW